MFGAETASLLPKKTADLERAICGSLRGGHLPSRAGAIATEVEAFAARLFVLESSLIGGEGEGGIVARVDAVEKHLGDFQG